MNINWRISEFLCDYIPELETVILAISGGPDSVCMLDVVWRINEEKKMNWKLVVAHYNHCQRETSFRDEEFVRRLAKKYKLDCEIGRLSKDAVEKKEGPEGDLRRYRYNFLKEVASRRGARFILLAHNLDDRAETVLMNLFRGAGPQGLKGISYVREWEGLILLRPLLSVKRVEIEKYLSDRELSYCIDETNFSTDFLRNKIRHNLLPLLEAEYKKGIKDVLVRLADIMEEELDFISSVAGDVLNGILVEQRQDMILVHRNRLESLHPAILRQCFRMIWERLSGTNRRLAFSHYQEFVKMIKQWPEGSILSLPLGIRVEKDKQFYRFYQLKEDDDAKFE